MFNRTRVDGAEFYVGEAELGHIHIHLNGEVHLATTPGLGLPLLARALARPFPYGQGPGDWVLFQIRTAADHATWLFRLNYERLQGQSLEVLTKRLRAGRGY